MGGSLMKFKLFLGFVQCVSFFPVTFATIPWPSNFVNLGHILKLFAVDLFGMFGAAFCDLSTGFYQEFLFSMVLMPLVLCGAGLAYAAVVYVKRTWPDAVGYTIGSARTRLYTLLFTVVYALYTGVATKLFVLFKCLKIQDTWFLVADMRITCFDETYNAYRVLSYLGIVVYVVGIPVCIFVLLFQRRVRLYEETCPADELDKHMQVKKSFGSIYSDYTPANYYFDLLDLGRRLLLTGGLILVGEESNTQIFLGLLLNVLWFGLVLLRRPYRAYWDNVLSVVLSLQLVLIMLCGTALELDRLTEVAEEKGGDVYEQRAFEVLMFVFTLIVVLTAMAALVISIPCLRERVALCCAQRRVVASSLLLKPAGVAQQAGHEQAAADGRQPDRWSYYSSADNNSDRRPGRGGVEAGSKTGETGASTRSVELADFLHMPHRGEDSNPSRRDHSSV